MADPSEKKEWLSLQQASERLGVSPATLRAWADRGRVHAFRTPGGHRRFRERDLAALVSDTEPVEAGRSSRVLAHLALGRTRFEVSDGWLGNESWYRRFPQEAREEHRQLGRQVVLALSELMSLPNGESLIASRAVELGRHYGELNARHSVSLPDAIRAFIFFRDSFIESLVELAHTSPGLDSLTLMRRTTRFVDQMLLTMVETYTTLAMKGRVRDREGAER